MFGSLTLPALLLFVLSLLIPESPRWLMKMGRRTRPGRRSARRRGGRGGARAAGDRTVAAEETGTLSELLGPGYRRALMIGVALAVFCQFSGINAIMYYAPEIFKSSGAGLNSSFLADAAGRRGEPAVHVCRHLAD